MSTRALAQAVYDVLDEERPTTVAGLGYLLRDMELPPACDELIWLMESLVRGGFVSMRSGPCGLEYLKVRRE